MGNAVSAWRITGITAREFRDAFFLRKQRIPTTEVLRRCAVIGALSSDKAGQEAFSLPGGLADEAI